MSKQLPFEQRRFVSLKEAAAFLGISVASLYRFNGEGRLQFKRLAGRTLAQTSDLLALADGATEWTPSTRSRAAVTRRKELARAAQPA